MKPRWKETPWILLVWSMVRGGCYILEHQPSLWAWIAATFLVAVALEIYRTHVTSWSA